jgi:LysM repeat protein
MKTKSNPPKSLQRGFNAERFWRHYVAAVESDDASWSAEQTKGGNAGRIFMFLLLFHVFLIGAAVLFNVVAERPRPEFVDSTKPVPKPTAPTQKVTQNEKPKAPPAVPVVSRPNTVAITVSATDTLKSIAEKAGATPAEIAQLNRIDPNTQVAPGSTLQVPTGRTAVVQAAKVHHVTVAAHATTNVPKAGAAEAFQATQPPSSISNPKPADAAPPSKVPTVADKLPRDTVKAKIPEADTPPAPKPAAAPAIAKESESQKVAPAKVTPVEKTAPAKTVTESRTHTVKPKDTFYSISRKYHVPVKELMRINGVTDPGRLREGTVLKIPAK